MKNYQQVDHRLLQRWRYFETQDKVKCIKDKEIIMTDILLSAKVNCSDGHCGQSTEVIVNPVKKKITHFVVEDSSLPDYDTRLVPIEKVASTSHDSILLDCNRDEFVRMEPFITSRYIEPVT